MTKWMKWYLFLLFIAGCNGLVYTQGTHPPEPQMETGKTMGFDVIFVVDVSPGIGEKTYIQFLENFVTLAYDTFRNSVEINSSNNFYLITLAEEARLFENDNPSKESILQEIKARLPKKKKQNKLKKWT